MPRTIIISGSTEDYYPLLVEMLSSLHHAARGEQFHVGVLDLGLTSIQRQALEKANILLVRPEWDYDVQSFAEPAPEYWKALTSRPHLRRYFPGYDVYVWIDADCWVQDWKCVKLYVDSARAIGFAITPECDRGYWPYYAPMSVLQFALKAFRDCVDEDRAQWLAQFPLINGGVFAAAADAPHWSKWSNVLGDVIQRRQKPDFLFEQTSLNVVLRTQDLQTAFLPSRCNWMCNRALPRLSPDAAEFLEAQAPFQPLGIVHLTCNFKNGEWPMQDLQGRTVVRSLRYNGKLIL